MHATHNQSRDELAFYGAYFEHATCYGDLNRMYEIAEREAILHGIAVVDAFHLAAAHLTRSILITGEKITKPMFRTRIVRVRRFHDLAD